MKTRPAAPAAPLSLEASPEAVPLGRRAALAPAVASALTVLAVATVYATPSIFGDLATAFSVEPARTRLAFSAASLFYALAFFVLGPLTDRVSKPRMALAGGASLALVMLLADRARTFDGFLVGASAAGACAAAVPVAMFPYMAQIAPRARVASYLGLLLAATILGIIVGRSATGILAARWGFRRAFDALAVLVGVVSALTLLLPSPEAARGTSAGSLSGAYRRALSLVVQPGVGALLLSGFLLFFGYLGIVTFLTFRLTMGPFHYSSAGVSWVSLTGAIAILGAPIAGAVSQRIGARAMILSGMGVALAAVQAMAWGDRISVVVAGTTALYLGVFSSQPSLLVLVTRRAPRDALGSASALYLLACLGGGSFASTALGTVWARSGWTGVSLACTAALVLAAALAAKAAKGSPLHHG